jgi:hypothetical protein
MADQFNSTVDFLPRRSRGRQSAEAEAAFQARLAEFCELILQIKSTMDFKVGSRGWGYILENRGLITKGEFDACARIINDARKSGMLPVDICAEDETRATTGLQGEPDSSDIKAVAKSYKHWLLTSASSNYLPFLFFDDLDLYVEVGTEKLDLRNLPRN